MTAKSPRSSTRRQFLGHGAAAAGIASIAGCSATADDYRIQLSPPRSRTPLQEGQTIKMGVIGVGGMGRGHCGAIMNIAKDGRENVQIVAVCDVAQPSLAKAKKMCEEAQGVEVETYGDYRNLLERGDLHAVLIASPEHWHAQQSADAIAAGKDVYCEKPMTHRLPEALQLREYVNSTDAIFQVGTQFVSIPMYSQAREMIRAGAIGHPTCSQTSYCRNSKNGEWLYYELDESLVPDQTIDWEAWCGHLGPEPWNVEVFARWRRYKKWSTGIIGDLLVHKMTPLLMAIDAGWPTRVVASGGHYVDKAMENHDQVNIQIEFENDHTMVVMGSTCNATGISDVIRGHKANMFLGGNRIEIRPEQIYADDVDPETVNCEALGDSQDQHRVNWLNSIRTREQPLSDIDLGSKIMVAVDLAARSMWEGKAYHFDPEEMRIAGA